MKSNTPPPPSSPHKGRQQKRQGFNPSATPTLPDPAHHCPEGLCRFKIHSRTADTPPLGRPLLQVLQDAAVAEVVDVAAEVDQLGVDVCGHAAVERRGEVGATGNHAGAARRGMFGPPLHQGTKSKQEEDLNVT